MGLKCYQNKQKMMKTKIKYKVQTKCKSSLITIKFKLI